VRHRRLVLVAWLAVILAGLTATGHVAGRLSQQFSLPVSRSWGPTAAAARPHRSCPW
jgi:hypothetical protein